MPRYRYTAHALSGTSHEGTALANDLDDLEASLLSKGLFLKRARPAISATQMMLIRRFRRSEVTRLTRQMHILLASEISVLDVLQLVREQVSDKVLGAVFEDVIAEVESGKNLADAMREYPGLFDELYLSMIEAGESAGKLSFVFDRIATYRERHDEVARKVKSAMAYPFLVTLVAVLVMMALVLYVIPVFSSMYANFGAELPSLTQRVVSISSLLREWFWYWLTGLILMVLSLIVVGATSQVKRALHRLMLLIPFVKPLAIKLITARFCRTMGALLQSGVDIIYALRIASRTTGNSFAHDCIEPAELSLAQGKSFTDAVTSAGLFPKAMLRLSAAGEKTGRLGEMLSRAADYYENEAESNITTLTTLIEPVIILVLGVFIAFVLVAMYLPLFDLVGAI